MRTYTLNLSTNSKINPPLQSNVTNTLTTWNVNWRELFGNKTGECRVRAVLQSIYVSAFSSFTTATGITFGAFGSKYCNVCCSSNGQYVYVLQQNPTTTSYDLYISSNGGTTFTRASSTLVSNIWYSQLVCDSTGQYVWFSGNNSTTLYHSSNYGVTINTVTVGASVVYGLGISSDGTILVTANQQHVAYCSNGTSGTPTFTAGTTANTDTGGSSFLATSSSGQYCYYAGVSNSRMFFSNDYGHTYSRLNTSTIITSAYQGLSCDVTGQYVVYLNTAQTYCYLSNNYGTTWTLINTTPFSPFGSLTNIKLFISTTSVCIVMSGKGSSPYTNNLYGGTCVIANCLTPSSWTWTTLASDQEYAGIAISNAGNIFAVGQTSVIVGKILI